MTNRNRWHHRFLPDDYRRKLKQDLAEVDEAADSVRRLEPESEERQEGGDE
jgi:hypothetical protein